MNGQVRDFFGGVIHRYTRADAIADGVLIDVTPIAQEAGFKVPVAVTQTVWESYIKPSAKTRAFGQSVEGRLWDVLTVLHHACRRAESAEINFDVEFIMKAQQRRRIWLKSIIGPGDSGEPVITIMLPGED